MNAAEGLGAVLPVKLAGRHYRHNLGYCDLLFSSLRHFGLESLFDTIEVVVPGNEVGVATEYFAGWVTFPVRVVDEARDPRLAPLQACDRPHQRRPWHRQQIIKLLMAATAETPFVLTLDPDVIALRRLARHDLVRDGRAILEPEPRATHAQWWHDSAAVLGVDANTEGMGMNVTPSIYAAEICRTLAARIEEVHRRPWVEHLLGTYTVWTEQTLYFTALERFSEVERHHFLPGPRDLHLHSPVNFWTQEEVEAADFGAFFAPENAGCFGVIQSAAGADPSALARRLAPWLPASVGDHRPVRHPLQWVSERAGSASRAARRAVARRRGG